MGSGVRASASIRDRSLLATKNKAFLSPPFFMDHHLKGEVKPTCVLLTAVHAKK